MDYNNSEKCKIRFMNRNESYKTVAVAKWLAHLTALWEVFRLNPASYLCWITQITSPEVQNRGIVLTKRTCPPQNFFKTRIHSSRMRIVRCSGRRAGCIQACTGQGGCLPKRVSAQEGSVQGGCLPRGVCLPKCMLGYTPVDRIFDKHLWKYYLKIVMDLTVKSKSKHRIFLSFVGFESIWPLYH